MAASGPSSQPFMPRLSLRLGRVPPAQFGTKGHYTKIALSCKAILPKGLGNLFKRSTEVLFSSPDRTARHRTLLLYNEHKVARGEFVSPNVGGVADIDVVRTACGSRWVFCRRRADPSATADGSDNTNTASMV